MKILDARLDYWHPVDTQDYANNPSLRATVLPGDLDHLVKRFYFEPVWFQTGAYFHAEIDGWVMVHAHDGKTAGQGYGGRSFPVHMNGTGEKKVLIGPFSGNPRDFAKESGGHYGPLEDITLNSSFGVWATTPHVLAATKLIRKGMYGILPIDCNDGTFEYAEVKHPDSNQWGLGILHCRRVEPHHSMSRLSAEQAEILGG